MTPRVEQKDDGGQNFAAAQPNDNAPSNDYRSSGVWYSEVSVPHTAYGYTETSADDVDARIDAIC
ncbi:hypothetical protein [Paraburkholderia aspalathi]|uniref:hypothetical protein n=1 Tax=Paraburkholderia aspalathi TaxID=1324617 RepID=UPI0038BBA201